MAAAGRGAEARQRLLAEAGPARCWAARDKARAVACARKEGSWADGCQGNGLRAESEEEMERKEEIPFFIFRVFQKYFSNGFEFLFSNLVKPIIPRMNLQQHVCIKRLLTL